MPETKLGVSVSSGKASDLFSYSARNRYFVAPIKHLCDFDLLPSFYQQVDSLSLTLCSQQREEVPNPYNLGLSDLRLDLYQGSAIREAREFLVRDELTNPNLHLMLSSYSPPFGGITSSLGCLSRPIRCIVVCRSIWRRYSLQVWRLIH